MTTDDMQACRARLAGVNAAEAIAEYGEGVIQNIVDFLNSNNTEAFDRVVPAPLRAER